MALTRWDPFVDMLSLRDAMNRLFEDSFVRPGSLGLTASEGRMDVPVDLRETENEYILEAALPGFKPEDIELTIRGNTVTLRGQTQHEEERQDQRYHFRERRFGQFQRSLTLPDNIEADKVTSEYNNGLLTLTLPKAEETKPRRIQITGTGQPKQIEQRNQPRLEGAMQR